MSAKLGDPLTIREHEVLRGMAEGLSNREIGTRLFLSEDTIKTHARRLYRKLGARDRAHAVRIGIGGVAEDLQRKKKRVRAVLDAHRTSRDMAPPDSLYARLFDAVEAALADPPS